MIVQEKELPKQNTVVLKSHEESEVTYGSAPIRIATIIADS